jgi:hypothetical protein
MSNATHSSQLDSANNDSCWHEDFLRMLPKIEEQARYQFRHLKGDHQDEAVQEVICNCCLAYARLVEQARAEAATWSSLARYGIAQVRVGRRVGASLNIKDITSPHCQQRKRVDVRSLHRWDHQNEEWSEMVVEDRQSTPADVAAFRIDFREFLRSLSRRNRQIALTLCKGESAQHVARLFRISSGRVSQLRRELCEAWREFHGELSADNMPALVSPA